VLYLGAGVSTSVGIPTWPELIRALTVTMMTRKVGSAIGALEGLNDEDRWSALSAIQEDVAQHADYGRPILMMARALKDSLGEELASLLAGHLYRRFKFRQRIVFRRDKIPKGPTRRESEDGTYLPSSSLLDAIVALARAERDVKGVQALVSYNFDDIVDEALRRSSVRCKTVVSGRDNVPPGTLPCYHVHGVLPFAAYLSMARRTLVSRGKLKAKGNLVFSEDQYHAEYADPYKWSNMTQMSLLGRFAGLFVGLSMEDPNIRRLVDVTHSQYPDVPNYAILPRRVPLSRGRPSKKGVLRNLFEDVENTSFAGIGVKVIWVDDYDQVPEVLTKVCDLDATQQLAGAGAA
jgi:gluconate kinase